MPRGGRGGKRSHKGEHRRFTGFEELAAQSKEIEKERERGWNEKEGEEGGQYRDTKKESGSDSDSSSDEEEVGRKGVQGLIEIENPNRVQKKSSRKVTDLEKEEDVKPELSRREREELQKQHATAEYVRRHKAGKTDEARADLARLAIIRKEREEAAKKREEERKAKEAAKAKGGKS